MELRAEVQRFAEAMENKLLKNDWKRHWSHMNIQYLSMRLSQEREELRKAVERGDPEEILSEAADVANFAMFIAETKRKESK